MDEVIRRFNARGVRYLLIGGQAVRLEGFPRFSMDWDFFIPGRDQANVDRINLALADELDAPVVLLGPKGENFVQTYQTAWGVLQFHLGGPGLPRFDEAEERAVVHNTEDGIPAKCLNGRDLLAAKERTGRPQDLQDIEFLRRKAELGLL